MPNTGDTSPEQLLGNIDKLMNAVLATSTKMTYTRAWDHFNVFSLAMFGKGMFPQLFLCLFLICVTTSLRQLQYQHIYLL